MRLLLLGTPRLEDNGGTPLHIDRRKAFALLIYLAVTQQPQSRDTLAALFWPDHDQARALAYLRQALWTLNKVLGETWAELDRETVSIRSGTLETDVQTFQQLVTAQEDDPRDCVHTLSQAAELYRGDFLQGFSLPDSLDFEEWQFFQTEQLRRQYANALERLIRCRVALGELEQALLEARRWLALDRLNEEAHAQIMRLHEWMGQHAAALQQYQELVRLLQAELGTVPSPEIVHLHTTLQARQLPPPASTGAVRTSPQVMQIAPLPEQIDQFLGRTDEMADLLRLLDDPACRLITVVGVGGMGKTTLAIQTARRSNYPVCFVGLASVCCDEFVLPTLAVALGQQQSGAQHALKAQLFDTLHDQRLLLLIDNFEHVLDTADLLTELLTHAPQVKILVTSRQRLNLREEWVFEVEGLSYPAQLDDPQIDQYSAVQLLVQRARRLNPQFASAATDLPHLARICQLVQGMPLGIELAATWAQTLSAPEIAQEIERGLDFLSTEARDVPERHRSVQAMFEQVWATLSPAEQACLSQLSVFRGTFDLEAARAVAGASLHVLRALIGKSLLRRTSSGHYHLHELLRQFAAIRLSPSDQQATPFRHATYYADLLRENASLLKGKQQLDALNRIDAAIDNIRSAWLYACHQRLVWFFERGLEALTFFSMIRNRFEEHLDLIQHTIEAFVETTDLDQQRILAYLLIAQTHFYKLIGQLTVADASRSQSVEQIQRFTQQAESAWWLTLLGDAFIDQGRVEEQSAPLIQQGLDLSRAAGDVAGTAFALLAMGTLYHESVQYDEARHRLDESLALFQQVGQAWGTAQALTRLAEIDITFGNYDQSRPLLQTALPLLEQVGDQRSAAWVRASLGWYTPHGTIKGELPIMEANLALYRKLGDRRGMAWALFDIGHVSRVDGAHTNAWDTYQESFALFEEIGDKVGMAWVRIYQALLALEQGDLAQVQTLIEDSLAAVADMDFPWVVSGAYFVLGKAALAAGDIQAARRYLLPAVQLAHQVHSTMQTLRHLAGVALLLLHEGSVEDAVELAHFASTHPAVWHDAQRAAANIMTQAEQHLPAATIQQAQERAKTLTIEAAIERWIGEPSRTGLPPRSDH